VARTGITNRPSVRTNHKKPTTAQEPRGDGQTRADPESGEGAERGAKTGGGDGVEIEMRALRLGTRAGGEGEAGVVLEGVGFGLGVVETRSCHVARTRGRGGGGGSGRGLRFCLGVWLGEERGGFGAGGGERTGKYKRAAVGDLGWKRRGWDPRWMLGHDTWPRFRFSISLVFACVTSAVRSSTDPRLCFSISQTKKKEACFRDKTASLG
jgi:hypothetical protein